MALSPVIHTRPPSASIERLTSDSPIPIPLVRRLDLVLKNGSNTRSRNSSGTPGPSSRTDSRSVRGARHAEVLARLHGEGARAVLLFVVQRADCDRVEPADDIDPAYGAALRAAAGAGVEVLAVRARVGPGGLRFDGRLPVRL